MASRATRYGLRLVIPLVDQYDYYHGGIPSFLRFRGLPYTNPAADYAPFYTLDSLVYKDFTTYITALLTHPSNITGVRRFILSNYLSRTDKALKAAVPGQLAHGAGN